MNQLLHDAPATQPSGPDFSAVKTRQQAMWASGDFAVIGTTLQIAGESLCEAVDVEAGTRVPPAPSIASPILWGTQARLSRR